MSPAPASPPSPATPIADRDRALLEAQAALTAGRAKEAAVRAHALIKNHPNYGEAWLLLGWALAQLGSDHEALLIFKRVLAADPRRVGERAECARLLGRLGRLPEAMEEQLRAVRLAPGDMLLRQQLADLALRMKLPGLVQDSLDALQASDAGPEVVAPLREGLNQLRNELAASENSEGWDLLITHNDVNRLHGTGVLLERYFPDSARFVVLRSQTHYDGRTDLPAIHLVLGSDGMTEKEEERSLRLMLDGLHIRRILCVPYYESDVRRAELMSGITGAPLCAYVMDDQTIHARGIRKETARRMFQAARLRLVISPEMQAAYERQFGLPFTVMPPLLTSADGRLDNQWRPSRSAPVRAALVGNVWSAQQFAQLRRFVRSSGLQLDWFGNAKARGLPADPKEYEADGIFARGFLPESELARKLVDYPFVVVPSGQLDGTETNEWLTRLSLPSRMVFIMGRTMTPMLVIGHPATAASQFVSRFGLGAVVPYDAADPREAIRPLLEAELRQGILANIRRCADKFVQPDAGEWIWRSLEAGRALPAPFLDAYAGPLEELERGIARLSRGGAIVAAYGKRLLAALQAADSTAAITVMRQVLADPTITDANLRLEILALACSTGAVVPPTSSLLTGGERQTCLLLYQPWFGFDLNRLIATASARGIFMPLLAGKRVARSRRLSDLDAANFRTYVYRGISLWSVCQYELALEFGAMPEDPSLGSAEQMPVIHAQFAYAVEFIDEAFDFVRCYRPDSIILAQGHFTNAAVMRQVGVLSGVRVVSLENTLHRGRLLWEDVVGAAVNTHLAKNYYWRYRSFVTEAQAGKTARDYLATIRQHKSAEHQAPAADAAVPFADELPTIVYLGQVSTDAAVLYGRHGFASQAEAICAAADYAASRGLRLIVKLHPKESPSHEAHSPQFKNLTRRWLEADARFQRLRGILGDRLTMDSDNKLDTYALIRRADVCVTLTSQSGLEALLHDKEVVLCGEASFGSLGFTHEAPDAVALHFQLDRVLKHGHRVNDGTGCRKFFHIFNELYCLPKTEETLLTLASGRPSFPVPDPITAADLSAAKILRCPPGAKAGGSAACAAPTDTPDDPSERVLLAS